MGDQHIASMLDIVAMIVYYCVHVSLIYVLHGRQHALGDY